MNNELYHYGVLGMKWGVRRDRSRSGGSRKKRSMSDDARDAYTIKKKKVSQMSNAELRKLNERTRLEQEYSRLNPKSVSRGWKYVATAAGVMGTALSVYNSGSQLVQLGKKAGNGIVNVVGDQMLKELARKGL